MHNEWIAVLMARTVYKLLARRDGAAVRDTIKSFKDGSKLETVAHDTVLLRVSASPKIFTRTTSPFQLMAMASPTRSATY